MTNYVFEGTEVVKTGRRAQRKVAVPGQQPKIFEVVEIEPAEDPAWKKWVRPDDLYEIIQ